MNFLAATYNMAASVVATAVEVGASYLPGGADSNTNEAVSALSKDFHDKVRKILETMGEGLQRDRELATLNENFAAGLEMLGEPGLAAEYMTKAECLREKSKGEFKKGTDDLKECLAVAKALNAKGTSNIEKLYHDKVMKPRKARDEA